MIYHMLPERDWRAVDPAQGYRPPSLASEGFIHCSGDWDALLHVANAFYADQPGEWMVLVIDPAAVAAAIRWEPADGRIFPHIYGPLNVGAVASVLPLPRAGGQRFLRPPQAAAEAA